MIDPDDLLVAVEHLVVAQNRDDAQTSDGAAGDSGDNRDG